MNAEEQRIWDTFCHLNLRGREKAVTFLLDLAELEKYKQEER